MLSPSLVSEKAYGITKAMMHAILKKYLDEETLSHMMQPLGIRSREAIIFFLTQLILSLRQYPDSLFDKNELRMQFVNIIQEFLDEKIFEENNDANW